ncbi:polysaccharide biosynthesis C-terminal domain-containing protein [Cellulomonas sp.]|uniref:lipopolysaccharide biosynthesis protein n=1 Tax=Cellulomonas sp. TaxID=40001 RepID=UPI0028118F1D|nr:polysaccharide biosynthesis C-terminal domain-containing protein [Cellulomonas sp.]
MTSSPPSEGSARALPGAVPGAAPDRGPVRTARTVLTSRTSGLLVAQVVAAAAAFGINLMAARVMDPDGRGVLALALQVSYIATTAALLGIEAPYVARRAAPFPVVARELTSLLRPGYWFTGLAVAAAVVLYLGGRTGLATTVLLASVYAFGNTHVRAVRTAYIASGAFRPFAATAVVSQLALLAAGAVLLVLEVADPNVWIAVYALLSMVALVVLRTGGRRAGTTPDRAALTAVRRQGLRLVPASFGNTAMLRSDRLLLPALASASELGLYVVVATATEIAGWPVKQWVDASLRRWRDQPARTPGTLRLVATAAALALGLSAVLAGVTYAAVTYLLPEAYHPSRALLLPLGAATVVYAATRVQQGLLVARGEAGRVSAVELAGMAVSVVLYVVLIPGWGAMGAAVGSLVGYSACLAAGAVALRQTRHAGPELKRVETGT